MQARRTPLRLSLTLTTALALTLGLAACGSDPSSGSPAPPSTAPPTTAPPATAPPSTAPPSTVPEPSATVEVEIDDGTFASIDEMAGASALVVVGDVVSTASIGRPDLGLDPAADEYVAIAIRPTERLVGDSGDEIVLAWNAYSVDAQGSRTAVRVMNGLRPPAVGDHVLLFLDPVDPAFAEHVGGAPTHQLVKLDGLVHLDGDRVVGGEASSPVLAQMLGMTIAALRSELAAA